LDRFGAYCSTMRSIELTRLGLTKGRCSRTGRRARKIRRASASVAPS